jgi:hypothetical protein
MGWGQGGEMNQALYAHMNNKRKRKKNAHIKKKKKDQPYSQTLPQKKKNIYICIYICKGKRKSRTGQIA